MAEIEVPCANQECDCTDVDFLISELFLEGFKHRFHCNRCNTRFSICTVLTDMNIPEVISS